MVVDATTGSKPNTLRHFPPVTRTAPAAGRRAGPLLLRPTSLNVYWGARRTGMPTEGLAVGFFAVADAVDFQIVAVIAEEDAMVLGAGADHGRVQVLSLLGGAFAGAVPPKGPATVCAARSRPANRGCRERSRGSPEALWTGCTESSSRASARRG